jgi:hypothetical protein
MIMIKNSKVFDFVWRYSDGKEATVNRALDGSMYPS